MPTVNIINTLAAAGWHRTQRWEQASISFCACFPCVPVPGCFRLLGYTLISLCRWHLCLSSPGRGTFLSLFPKQDKMSMLQLGASSSANRTCWFRLHWPGSEVPQLALTRDTVSSTLQLLSRYQPQVPRALKCFCFWSHMVCVLAKFVTKNFIIALKASDTRWGVVPKMGRQALLYSPISFLAVWLVERQRRLLITSAQLLPEACPRNPGVNKSGPLALKTHFC